MLRVKPDLSLLFISFLLIIFGILILTSVSIPYSQKKYNKNFYYVSRQIFFGFLPGFFLLFIFYKIRLSFFQKNYFWLFPFILILSLIVFFPGLGWKVYGAQRWVKIFNFSFQPIEILKPFIIIFFAGFLSLEKKKNIFHFLFFLFFLGIISFILFLQKDASTLLLLGVCLLLLYFISGAPFAHLIFLFLFLFLVGIFLIKIAPYRLNRILVFLNPDLDPLGIGYHLQQALISVGSGAMWGRGLGMSEQKFGLLPHPISDSIFAIYAEETGFIGSLVLLSLFLLFFIRCAKISKEAKVGFQRLVGFGITFLFVLQTFMNLGSMVGLFPISGIPLPFVSYGGSAIVGEMISLGILLNISKRT